MKRALLLLTFGFLASCVESDSDLKVFEGNLRGGLSAGEYALTFDDGPTPHTVKVLDTLAEYGIKATFFVQGNRSLQYPEILQRMKDEGHLVANHTYDHPKLPGIDNDELVRQIARTDRIIAPYVDGNAYFFRAPYGAWNLELANTLNEAGYSDYVGNIFWDIGGVLTDRYAADWNCWSKKITSYECGRRYINEIKDRRSGIVLMHDVTSNTSRMLKYILERMPAEYSFIRLDEARKYKNKLPM